MGKFDKKLLRKLSYTKNYFLLRLKDEHWDRLTICLLSNDTGTCFQNYKAQIKNETYPLSKMQVFRISFYNS